MLHGDTSVVVTYMAFDVLALDGEPTTRLPYTERHALLEEIVVDAPPALAEVVASFEDGQALWQAIVDRNLEGVVAKRAREPYRPGARLWVKTKNRTTARFQEELRGATRARRKDASTGTGAPLRGAHPELLAPPPRRKVSRAERRVNPL